MSDADIIDGKASARDLRERIGREVTELQAAEGITPGLAVVLVGDDPASHVYVRNKGRALVEAGMNSWHHHMSANASHAEVVAKVAEINADEAVDGILVQLPLPGHVDARAVINAVDPEKDIDGFHVVNVGRLWTGATAPVPCTPYGCLQMLKSTLGDLKGKRALVLGRSNIVGKPMAALLLAEHCTVTIAHSRTEDLAERCLEADILVAAVGRAQMVRGDWIKPGAAVIDVGINRIEAPEKGLGDDGTPKTRLVGDVAFDEAKQVAGFITPVPGGVGPMTIACLMRNTVLAAARQNGLKEPKI